MGLRMGHFGLSVIAEFRLNFNRIHIFSGQSIEHNISSQSSFDIFEHQTMVDGFKNMLLGLVLEKFIELKKIVTKVEKNEKDCDSSFNVVQS